METIRCNLCGADDPVVIQTGYDRLTDGPGAFTLVECKQCSLIYLNPRPIPSEIGIYYPATNYHPYLPAIDDEPSWFRRLDRRFGLYKRCQEVSRRVKITGDLLDVGCATGIFLEGMRQRGWQVKGVELNAEVAQYARQRLKLDVLAGSLEEAHYPTACFDLVTLWDVLEHVYDPKETLQEIARLLRPGGWLVFSLPDPDCIEARWLGPYWAGWDMPRHLQLFRRNVLQRLLMETGFEIMDRSYFTGRYGALMISLQFWSAERLANPALRQIFMRLVRSLPARLLSLPYYAIADRLAQSTIVTIFARKLPHA